MSNWYSDDGQKVGFNAAVSALLKQAGIYDDPTGFDVDAAIDKYKSIIGQSVLDADNMAQGLERMTWFVNNRWNMPVEINQDSTVSVKVSVNVGAVTFEFGTTRNYAITNGSERYTAFQVLTQALQKDIRAYLEGDAKNLFGAAMGVASSAQSSGAPRSTSIVTEECIALEHGFEKNKHVFKMKTPRATKWGVPVYPEVLKAIDLDPDKIPMGESKFNGTISYVLKENGNPHKAIELDGFVVQ